MAGSTTITGTQRSQLESSHIRKLKNYDQFLGANSTTRDLVTGSIDSHFIASLFGGVIRYEKHPSIEIIKFLRDSVCLNFDKSVKLKLQDEFATLWNLDENNVVYISFLNKKQDKTLKWKAPCADAAMLIQAVSQMEFSDCFD